MIGREARTERRRWYAKAWGAGFTCLVAMSAMQAWLLAELSYASSAARVASLVVVVSTCALTAAFMAWAVTAAVAARWRRVLVSLSRLGMTGEAALEAGRFSDLVLLRTELEAAARRRQARLRHERAKDVLRRRRLAELVHDLATPIASAQTLVEAWRSRSPALCAALDGLMAHAGDLVHDLGTLGRVEAPTLTLRCELTELGTFVREVVAPFAALASARAEAPAILVRTETVLALVDRARLRSAIMNLVDNAVRHGEGAVTVRVEARSGGARLRVDNRARDEGGTLVVPARTRAPRPGEAHGLGLPWVRAVAAAHGATFSIEEIEGQVQAELTLADAGYSSQVQTKVIESAAI